VTVFTQAEATATPWSRLARSPLLRQFVKFCLVGTTSTAIDLGIFALLLHYGMPVRVGQALQAVLPGPLAGFLLGWKFPLFLTNGLSFILAVTNGFFWNRRWTFRAVDPTLARRQYASFFAVNVVGFLLNSTILLLLAHALPTLGVPPQKAALMGKLAAIPIVAFWNFTASKFWAFARGQAPDVPS
jgi:putative flippase GtrA